MAKTLSVPARAGRVCPPPGTEKRTPWIGGHGSLGTRLDDTIVAHALPRAG